MLLTLHITDVSEVCKTVAVKDRVAPNKIVPLGGVTVTVISCGGGAFTIPPPALLQPAFPITIDPSTMPNQHRNWSDEVFCDKCLPVIVRERSRMVLVIAGEGPGSGPLAAGQDLN
jgi:hypothetical protein